MTAVVPLPARDGHVGADRRSATGRDSRCFVEKIDLVGAGIDVRDRELVVVADVRGKRVPDVDGERLVVEARGEGKAALFRKLIGTCCTCTPLVALIVQ